MFQKFSCGCIGIIVGDQVRILVACDSDRDDNPNGLSWFVRDVSDKTSEPLSVGETQRLEMRIRDRLARADRFDDIQRALSYGQ